MTREKFIMKWLVSQKTYFSYHRDEMKGDLDSVIEHYLRPKNKYLPTDVGAIPKIHKNADNQE